MPPQMDYFYHESRVPSACGLTREDELEPDVISCMLVGDGAVGKTSMIVSYTSNGYPAEYQQTGFDVFSGEWSGTVLYTILNETIVALNKSWGFIWFFFFWLWCNFWRAGNLGTLNDLSKRWAYLILTALCYRPGPSWRISSQSSASGHCWTGEKRFRPPSLSYLYWLVLFFSIWKVSFCLFYYLLLQCDKRQESNLVSK